MFGRASRSALASATALCGATVARHATMLTAVMSVFISHLFLKNRMMPAAR